MSGLCCIQSLPDTSRTTIASQQVIYLVLYLITSCSAVAAFVKILLGRKNRMDLVVCSGSFNRSVCFILQDGFVGVPYSFETVIYPLFLRWLGA